MKALKLLIHSNIYISLAAVALTLATQIQLDMELQWHPYLFLIFFATLFEYNLHRLITILTNRDALKSEKHSWVSGNLNLFYLLMLFSVLGFLIAVFNAKLRVLLTLAPIAGLTLFYSTPISKGVKGLFRLRQIPFLKIFLIAFVWSSVTILLPVMYSDIHYNAWHIILMITERFLFIFAITIPFDIRDMEVDRLSGLQTIPLQIGVEKSLFVGGISLVVFWVVSTIHYMVMGQVFLVFAYSLTFAVTMVCLLNRKIQKYPLYHYAVLDGTMLLFGLLVIGFHYLDIII